MRAGGWLPFERFMELALYAPGLGYYSAGGAKIGAGGDFTTAPEISDLFSVCVARQCAEVLAQTGGSILELGAGTGRMAATILRDARCARCAARALRDSRSQRGSARPPARAHRAVAAKLQQRVVWLDRLPAKPMRGVMLANEVLDALAVPSRSSIRDGDACTRWAWRSRTTDAFVEQEQPPDDALARGRGSDSRASCRTSCPTAIEPRSACASSRGSRVSRDCLERGVMLLFDYGLPRAHYYHPQRIAGTLRCHFKHRAHDDPFINVGVQDITAWVDFTRVAEAADRRGSRGARLRDAGCVPARASRHRRRAGASIARAGERSASAADAGRDGRSLQGDGAEPRLRRAPARLRATGLARLALASRKHSAISSGASRASSVSQPTLAGGAGGAGVGSSSGCNAPGVVKVRRVRDAGCVNLAAADERRVLVNGIDDELPRLVVGAQLETHFP